MIKISIHQTDKEFILSFDPPLTDLPDEKFSKLVRIIAEGLNWKDNNRLSIDFDGTYADFGTRPDSTTLTVEETIWSGLLIRSNSKEVLEQIKPILEAEFADYLE